MIMTTQRGSAFFEFVCRCGVNPIGGCASAALMLVLLAAAVGAFAGEPRTWPTRDGKAIVGTFVSFIGDVVTIQTTDGQKVTVPLGDLSETDRKSILDLDDTPLPTHAPAWAPGYRIRYVLRAVGDQMSDTPKTILARLPTGGWLKPDAADVLVQSASGRILPAAVLSHDPKGSTIIQIERSGRDRWYWVYAINPDPQPLVEPELAKQISQAKSETQAALTAKMTLQKESADRSEELRKLTDEIERHKKTADNAAKEVAQWEKLIPERTTAANDARAKINPANQAASAASTAHEAAKAQADREVAKTQLATQEAADAKKASDTAIAASDAALKEAEAARAALPAAQQAAVAANDALTKARAQAPNDAEAIRKAEDAARAATDTAQRAEKRVADSGQASEAAKAARANPEQLATQKAQAAKAAEEAAMPSRLAERKAATEKDQAAQALQQVVAASKAADRAVEDGQATMTRAQKIKAEADAAIAELTPSLAPLTAAADAARAAAAEAVARARTATEHQRQISAGADPTIHQEGMTLEVRQWAGDELSNWPLVWDGLHKSDTVLGNAIVPEVLQNMNPARPSDPLNFAASYRGYLKIDQPGVYRFFVNGDDAAFLFIDGYKVYSRIGTNRPASGKIPLYAVGTDIELEQGVHPFEVHHVVGNTPGATGLCTFLWLTPDSKEWKFVPTAAFPAAMVGVPVLFEEARGGQVAAFNWGIDDTLSSDGVSLYLARFEAAGAIKNPDALQWDFGDATTAKGRSITHIYFQQGDYEVSLLSGGDLPPFRRRVHVWTPPVPTSPLSLPKAVEVLSTLDLAKLDRPKLDAMFEFLLICEQPNRWPPLERLSRHLLAQKGLDIKYRMYLYTSLMEAMAQQGHAAEAVKLKDEALGEFAKLKTLQAGVVLETADIYRLQLKDYAQAGDLYERLVSDNRRLHHPLIRQAAVSWGDMFLDADDQARAGETYRLASSLGQGGFAGETMTDATTRGALLRVAEQQLKGGDIRQTRRLLDRIETEFPEQKLEGLYRFLRGETDRCGGRYDSAIRSYEVLLKLRQWAGYRPQALYGIADSYDRMGDFDNALKWLGALKESFPAFYDERKLEPYQAMIEKRQERRKAAQAEGKPLPGNFAGYRTGFEPEDHPQVEGGARFRFIPTLGIDGTQTLFVDYVTDSTSQIYAASFQNVQSEGNFWAEFWYRNTNTPATNVTNTHVHMDFWGDGNAQVQGTGRQTVYPERTYGEWGKVAGRLRAPVTQDGRASLLLVFLNGVYEIDGFKVTPITDQQDEALRNFIEGAHPH